MKGLFRALGNFWPIATAAILLVQAFLGVFHAVSATPAPLTFDSRPWALSSAVVSTVSSAIWVAVFLAARKKAPKTASPWSWSILGVLLSSVFFAYFASIFVSHQASGFKLGLLLAAGTGCAGLWTAWRLYTPRLSGSAHAVEVILLYTSLAILGIEALLRIWSAFSPSPWTVALSGEPEKLIRAFKLTPYTPGPYMVNSLGFNDTQFQEDKASSSFRIAAISDSFGVGVVKYDRNVFTLLEKKLRASRPDLNIEVYNFSVACGSIDTYYSLYNTEIKRFSPDLLVLMLFAGNDLEPPSRQTLFEPGDLLIDRLVTRALAWLKVSISERENSNAQKGKNERDWTPPVLPRKSFIRLERHRLAWIASKDLEKRARPVLDRLERLIREAGVPVMLAVAPDQVQVDPLLLGDVARGRSVGRDELFKAQEILKKLAGKTGASFVDLTPGLLDAEKKGHRTYCLQNTHWNELGNEVAARELFGALDKMLRKNMISDTGN
ncbi:MAG: hypothetical protein GXP49_07845 [Deltaproteobacteria bacterium]|nr:hypothetical protein [Deltaproteobacteria bacterium]